MTVKIFMFRHPGRPDHPGALRMPEKTDKNTLAASVIPLA